MNKTFFNFYELLRIAIGRQEALSRVPSAQEWKELYDVAKKQSLVGVCFAGVQKILAKKGGDPSAIGLPEMQYLTWMGMAAKIQQRNELVNKQCVELQMRLTGDGLPSCILKGQGCAAMYPSHLSGVRQSGDIDVWVDAPRERIMEYVNSICPAEDGGGLHVGLHVFQATEVEVHFTPSMASGKKVNSRLQAWFERQKVECFSHCVLMPNGKELCCPTVEFNLVFLLHHIFRHYLYEGVGMRQMMDYYWTLVSVRLDEEGKKCMPDTLKGLGLYDFAGAVMYAMREVFHLDEACMICSIDEKRGRRLLSVIMEGGNFGHGTEKYRVTGWDKPWCRLSRYVRRNWFMLQDYPGEILSNMFKKFGL